jgi:hypothetical protein
MIRWVYRCLLLLHPSQFKREFAEEMLWIFDETAPEEAPALFGDVLISLARQWLLRSGSWKLAAAILGGLLQVSAGLIANSLTIPRLAVYPLDGAWTGRIFSSTSSSPMELVLDFNGAKWAGEMHMDAESHPVRVGRAGLNLAFRIDTSDGVMTFWGKPVRDPKGAKLAGAFETRVPGRKLSGGAWELTRHSQPGKGRP